MNITCQLYDLNLNSIGLSLTLPDFPTAFSYINLEGKDLYVRQRILYELHKHPSNKVMECVLWDSEETHIANTYLLFLFLSNINRTEELYYDRNKLPHPFEKEVEINIRGVISQIKTCCVPSKKDFLLIEEKGYLVDKCNYTLNSITINFNCEKRLEEIRGSKFC